MMKTSEYRYWVRVLEECGLKSFYKCKHLLNQYLNKMEITKAKISKPWESAVIDIEYKMWKFRRVVKQGVAVRKVS